jgi:AcrR family transcriptional regulator
MPLEAAPASKRERSKQARRVRVIDAAYSLLREIDMAEISVKMIAERAGVVPATVYNLFGTKAAVLVKVYERDLLAFEQLVSSIRVGDALDRIFDAASVAAARYRADPRFYRATLAVRDPGADSGPIMSAYRLRKAFWHQLVQGAVDQGLLRPRTDAERLSLVLIQIEAGTLSHWVSQLITVEEFERETSYGFAAALSSFATPNAQTRLQQRLKQFETEPTKGVDDMRQPDASTAVPEHTAAD